MQRWNMGMDALVLKTQGQLPKVVPKRKDSTLRLRRLWKKRRKELRETANTKNSEINRFERTVYEQASMTGDGLSLRKRTATRTTLILQTDSMDRNSSHSFAECSHKTKDDNSAEDRRKRITTWCPPNKNCRGLAIRKNYEETNTSRRRRTMKDTCTHAETDGARARNMSVCLPLSVYVCVYILRHIRTQNLWRDKHNQTQANNEKYSETDGEREIISPVYLYIFRCPPMYAYTCLLVIFYMGKFRKYGQGETYGGRQREVETENEKCKRTDRSGNWQCLMGCVRWCMGYFSSSSSDADTMEEGCDGCSQEHWRQKKKSSASSEDEAKRFPLSTAASLWQRISTSFSSFSSSSSSSCLSHSVLINTNTRINDST